MNTKMLAATAAMACVLASLAPAAQAQNAAPAAAASAPAALPSSPAKKALVQRILTLQKPALEVMATSLAEQPLAEMRQPVLEAVASRVPADQRDTTVKAIDADFRKYLDESVPIIRDKAVQLAPSTVGTLLESRLTEDELKTLVAFFESSASKKYAQVAPEAQNALVQKLVTDTRQTIEPKIRAVQQSVSNRLNAFPAPGAASAPAAAPAK